MTDNTEHKPMDRTYGPAEAVDVSFDAFEIQCPKCGEQVHVPYGRMPCPACGEAVFYDPMTNRPR